VAYDPTMKDAYAWWTMQFIDGLRSKTNDIPRDAEDTRTIVVIAAHSSGALPQADDLIYFEIPGALGRIQSLRAEVHIYLFRSVPSSPASALGSLTAATTSLWCKTEGLEMESGGVELRADWYIDDRRQPELKPTPTPFRPTPSAGMQQVRVRVTGPVFGKFEYLFDRGRVEWMPLFDDDASVAAPADSRAMLQALNLVPREDLSWHRVKGIAPTEQGELDGYQSALLESAPGSGSFILFSLRRRSEKADYPKMKRVRKKLCRRLERRPGLVTTGLKPWRTRKNFRCQC
jgi:hypothetical protein